MNSRRCDACQREFRSEDALLQHQRDKHQGDADSAVATSRRVPKKAGGTRGGRNGGEPLIARWYAKRRLTVIAAIAIIITIVASSVLAYHYDSMNNLGSHSLPSTGSPTTNVVYGIKPEDRAPDFQIFLVNGTTTSLSRFLGGSALLVYFVTTWCPGCAQAVGLLNETYYQELHAKGVTIIVVELYNDLGQSGPSITQFADKYAGGTSKPGWFYATTTQNATVTYDPNAYLEVYYVISASGIILYSGSSLAADLPNVVNEA
jgi:thiol-disulfide isomerase/thioredoxin